MRDRIVAHRGNAAEFRENSSDAIRSALKLGCKFIEVDTQVSSDLAPVLSHEATLKRVFGKDVSINDTPIAELKRMGVEPLYHATRLCEDYLATLFVEIKPESFERFGERAVTSIISNASGYVFISFCLDAVLYARRVHGERIGWIVPELSDRTREICESVQPDYLFCDQKKIPRNSKLWPGQWVAYEVPSPEMAAGLDACGVGLFETKNVKGMMCSL